MTIGELLKKARKSRNLSAKEVIKGSGIAASLSLYSGWEHGNKVPTPSDLEQLCVFLRVDLESAFSLWAVAHMPTTRLKALFEKPMSPTEAKNQSLRDPVAYPSAITKVIAESDADWFLENIWAGSILMRCLMLSNLKADYFTPQELAVQIPSKLSAIRTICKALVKKGYIIQSKDGYRMPEGIKYVYLPETERFEALRRARILENAKRTLANVSIPLLKKKSAVRMTLTKKISMTKAEEFAERLESLGNDLITVEDESPETSTFYQLICIFGPEAAHD